MAKNLHCFQPSRSRLFLEKTSSPHSPGSGKAQQKRPEEAAKRGEIWSSVKLNQLVSVASQGAFSDTRQPAPEPSSWLQILWPQCGCLPALLHVRGKKEVGVQEGQSKPRRFARGRWMQRVSSSMLTCTCPVVQTAYLGSYYGYP